MASKISKVEIQEIEGFLAVETPGTQIYNVLATQAGVYDFILSQVSIGKGVAESVELAFLEFYGQVPIYYHNPGLNDISGGFELDGVNVPNTSALNYAATLSFYNEVVAKLSI